MGVTTATRPRVYTRYLCARCGRRLKREHFVYSSHTGLRYCWPGEGCNR